ncbi:hypothetical protein Pint_02308 [Pistacia integerrima]|uniref:Uncharacterized protein n=1 Tax=Pistacia integerrima TaxID=434235 RepID=A0ACC0ZMT3_9ROSI|nr:hypothetical protein Pint_02308 [Pistacia integerrima]
MLSAPPSTIPTHLRHGNCPCPPYANILLPRPGFPYDEVRAKHSHLEVRHFDLLPEKGCEVDLDAVEALADENTLALVIINPGNPCGNDYTHQNLQKVG